MDRKRLSVSLSDKLAKKLDDYSEESGLSASEIARSALDEFFKRKESAHA